MITISSADNALKTLYLGVVSEQLNTNINPLLAKIERTSSDVWGKEIRKLAPYGINGGIGAGTEEGELPKAAENRYAQFVSSLKNLYGNIEITDKAMRASSNSAGAFVDLLNSEMQGLIRASKFNFGRMLYGDGSGILCKSTFDYDYALIDIEVDNVKNLVEGMVVDVFYPNHTPIKNGTGRRITSVDRDENRIRVDGYMQNMVKDAYFCIQGSKDLELTGLKAVFDTEKEYLYGVERMENRWMNPYVQENVGSISDINIQSAIDKVDERANSQANFIVCSSGVKRAYQKYLQTYSRNVDILNLQGGYKALSYNGLPLLSDRFVDEGTMYILNTDDLKLHQLCDWKWLEGENGKVIKQIAGRPTYSATLVKYADLMCDRPCGQAVLRGITEE